jgi:hypothetical protein
MRSRRRVNSGVRRLSWRKVVWVKVCQPGHTVEELSVEELFSVGVNELEPSKIQEREVADHSVDSCGLEKRRVGTLEPETNKVRAVGAKAVGAQATGARALGAVAVGAFALGAFAVGALAVGRLAIGRLTVRKSRIRRLKIDELDVGRLQVGELRVRETVTASSDQ